MHYNAAAASEGHNAQALMQVYLQESVLFVFYQSPLKKKKKAHTQNVTAPFYLNTNLKYTDIYIDTFSACKKKQLKSKTVKIILIEATSD